MSHAADSEITIVIADDHLMVREGLRSMLNAPRLRVIGEAGSGAEAVQKVLALKPSRLIYVSCDVATLARDARKIVDAGYAIISHYLLRNAVEGTGRNLI